MYNRSSRAYKLLYEAIIRKAILDQVEIGEDIYYKVNWRDDLDLENLWQESCLQGARINFWMQEKNWRMMNSYENSGCFLQMVELLLSTNYSIRYGDRKLLLQCITKILPYTFAFDHINYVRYLSVMLADKLLLPNDFPDVYKNFVRRNFAAQLTAISAFLRIKTDKVMETSLNKDAKVITFLIKNKFK